MRFTSSIKARVLLALLLTAAAAFVQAEEKVGVLLMHGKRGSAEHLQPLAEELNRQGYLVVVPEMPWSKTRAYDRPLEASHQEIDAALALLRLQGAGRLVVGGHSMGANMAIGYAATYPDVAAVMALGPGQTVESRNFLDRLGNSVAAAKELVEAGKADEPVRLLDLHLGKTSGVKITPRIYLSYFDPDGLANMPKSIAKVSMPLLWTVGDRDQNMLDRGPGYAFELAGANPISRYAVVGADHMGTPEASRAVVLEWLSSVFPSTSNTN